MTVPCAPPAPAPPPALGVSLTDTDHFRFRLELSVWCAGGRLHPYDIADNRVPAGPVNDPWRKRKSGSMLHRHRLMDAELSSSFCLSWNSAQMAAQPTALSLDADVHPHDKCRLAVERFAGSDNNEAVPKTPNIASGEYRGIANSALLYISLSKIMIRHAWPNAFVHCRPWGAWRRAPRCREAVCRSVCAPAQGRLGC